MKNFNFKKLYKPRREFVEKTKTVYLAAFNEKSPTAPKFAPAFAFNYVLRGAGVFVAIFILIGGTSAYAYEKNVGPTSILYPLKRINENVRLNFIPDEQKSSFHLGLAEKRLTEAEILKTKNADSVQAIRLAEEFKSQVKKSFETLPGPQETQEAISAPALTPAESQEQPQTQSQQEITEPVPISKPIQVISPNGGEVFKQGTPGAKSVKEPTKIQPPIFGSTKDTKLQEIKIKPPEEEKITPASPKIPQREPLKEIPICKFVDGLIKRGGDGIRKEIVSDPEILEKFSANCGGGLSGGTAIPPKPTE